MAKIILTMVIRKHKTQFCYFFSAVSSTAQMERKWGKCWEKGGVDMSLRATSVLAGGKCWRELARILLHGSSCHPGTVRIEFWLPFVFCQFFLSLFLSLSLSHSVTSSTLPYCVSISWTKRKASRFYSHTTTIPLPAIYFFSIVWNSSWWVPTFPGQ